MQQHATRIFESRLARQNVIVFAGGLVAGVGSFVYHAEAARMLGPALYGRVAFLISLYSVGATLAVVISIVLARNTAAATGAARSTALIHAMKLLAAPCIVVVIVIALFSGPLATFGHLTSKAPVLILGIAVALGWLLAVPRGILQGLQRFTGLAANLALEPAMRAGLLFVLLSAGYAITGSMIAVTGGLVVGLLAGLYALRDQLGAKQTRLEVSSILSLSLAAAAGIVGVQLLFNQDVALAEHFLSSHDGGIYGGLNKIETIVYYLTLSVSQVLFPRVVEAVTTRQHPARILATSAAILVAAGGFALLVFAAFPGVVVGVLYGSAFTGATAYVPAMGLIGLALSLDNLLVQFCIAVRDRLFMPILAAACIGEAALIVLFHGGVGQIVADVLSALVALLVLLSLRCYLLMSRRDRADIDASAPPSPAT